MTMKTAALALGLATTLASPALANCGNTVTFDQMARTPKQHLGVVLLCGRVDRVTEIGFTVWMRVTMEDSTNNWGGSIVVDYLALPEEHHVLEHDIIGVLGRFVGLENYQSIFDQTMTMPHVEATTLYTQVNTPAGRKWMEINGGPGPTHAEIKPLMEKGPN
jgi:hypothetical protein